MCIVIKSGEPPGGIGETGTTASIPALRNAIYAATGVALRRMPIDRSLLAGRDMKPMSRRRKSLSVAGGRRGVRRRRRLDDAAAPRAGLRRRPRRRAGGLHGPDPTGVPAELRSADLVTRGKYLAQAADCVVCHTAAGGQPFAGGRAFPTPFGVLYSPNITADRETGIGAWTDADFIRAVHEGVGKDGQRLYPAFPYEVLHAARRRRRAGDQGLPLQPAVGALPSHRRTALGFPFNQRWLMGFWSAFYNPDDRFQPHRGPQPRVEPRRLPGRSARRTAATAIRRETSPRRSTTGASSPVTVTQGWRAYNITADRASGVGAWSDAELVEYLRAGHAAGHGSPAARWREVVDALAEPADAGRHRSRWSPTCAACPADPIARPARAQGEAGLATTPKLMPAGVDPRGKQIFEGACASCHGWSGVSLLTSYATLTGDRAVNDPSGDQRRPDRHRRRAPADRRGGVMMPAFGEAYSDTEIAAVANYVTARFGAAASHITAKDVARLRRESSQ